MMAKISIFSTSAEAPFLPPLTSHTHPCKENALICGTMSTLITFMSLITADSLAPPPHHCYILFTALVTRISTLPHLKVHPYYAARHTAAKCDKAAWQKLRHATNICGRCVGLAATCRLMLRGLKIRSANCRFHQKKPRGI